MSGSCVFWKSLKIREGNNINVNEYSTLAQGFVLSLVSSFVFHICDYLLTEDSLHVIAWLCCLASNSIFLK